MSVGIEWIVDAEGCDSERLRSLDAVRAVVDRLVAALDLHVVGDGRWHVFPGEGGVTGLYLLTESHVACHTYPETRTATFNLYCCRAREPFDWAAELARALGAKETRVRTIARGRT
ncbi:MAG TPA: S-adenosylmethionine decarboxylase [Polyangiaceae bacterium]|jgi:S-adenosylmethionine decarboxylase